MKEPTISLIRVKQSKQVLHKRSRVTRRDASLHLTQARNHSVIQFCGTALIVIKKRCLKYPQINRFYFLQLRRLAPAVLVPLTLKKPISAVLRCLLEHFHDA